MEVETRKISREEVVEVFGEDKVAEYERNQLLGVERPLVIKENWFQTLLNNWKGKL